MKKIVYVLAFLFCGFLVYNSFFKKSEIEEAKEQYAKILKNHRLNSTPNLSKKERINAGVPPNEYFAEQYLLSINPYTGRTHPENLYKVQQELKELRKLQRRTPGDAIDNQWVERGPNNVGGRTRMVMFDPNDNTNKRVFAGGVSGGLWVNDDITDENSSWVQVGIDDNLAVTCIAVDPNNSQIMYLGTGELYNPQQALGNGIWKSTDGGATWTNVYQLRGTTSVTSSIIVPGTYFMTDIIVRDKDGNPATTNDSEVFASIGGAFFSSNPMNTFVGLDDYGIFKSTDDGTNWSQLTLDVDGNPIAANKFELGVDNTLWMSTTRNVYGKGGGRVYSSLDGTTFTLKHTIPDGRRTEIAVSKQDANTVYVLGRVYTLNSSNQLVAPFVSLLKTTDAFATAPTALSLPNDADTAIPADDFTRSQAWYNLVIEVDPTNDDIAYAGGIDLFRTSDSGTNWTQISKWSNNNNLAALSAPLVHADQHSWMFHPTDSNKAILGNDGGVYYATSLSTSSATPSAIEARNKNYNTVQFYSGAIGQSATTEYFLGGSQDNGTQFFGNINSGINSSLRILGGDGARSFIHKNDTYMIATGNFNRISRFNLPYTGSRVVIDSDSNSGSGFLNAMDLDDNLDILYANGSNHLARYTDITTNSPIRTNITNTLLYDITAIKVSPFTTTSSKVFAGTRTGKLVKIENANTATQTITDISSSSFLGSISSVEFGSNEDEIMVTFYNFGVDSIWFTDDGGITWNNKEGDFPDITVRCILMNPLNTDEVIIGTELGVWNTTNFKDASPIWNQSYNGMSNVVVTSLSLRTIDNTILASTYGRGFYAGQFKGNDLTTWTGTINSDFINTGNWSNGLPTSSVDVKIPATSNNPVLSSAVTVANLSIEKNASLTINETGGLTIDENSTNEGVFTINSTLANSGGLIVKGTSTGTIKYNRAVSDRWYLISSPLLNEMYDNDWVAANSIQSGTLNTNARGIATYNNNSGNWQYMLKDDIEPFTKGKGFSIKRTTAGSHIFSGEMPVDAVNINIDAGTLNGYNLIGNPFPSYIALNESVDATDNFLTQNASILSENSVYIWNGTSYIAVNQASFATYLAPGQGFFVLSNSSGGTISFAENLQEHQSETFLKSKQNTRPEIRLFCKNGKEEKYTDIFYIASATTSFDNGYDSSLFTGVSSDLEIYTKLITGDENKKLAIQSIPQEFSIVIPISIVAQKNTEIEISTITKNLNNDLKIYLEDKKFGTFTLLDTSENTYKFIVDENLNSSGRFFLHTSSEILNITQQNVSNIVIYNANNKIYIKNLSTINGFITIYNLQGKEVFHNKLTKKDEEIHVKNLSEGVYIVKVENDNRVFEKKILIQ